jgi:hypothetical protein
MKVDISSNMDAVMKSLSNVAKQSTFATMQALNDTAYAVRADLQAGMRSNFDAVTPYMLRSIWARMATKQKLVASVWPRYMGGKGYDPEHILMPHVYGGNRKVKASERALQKIGVLPVGWSIVPGKACPLDGYGNPDRGAIVKMLSYMKAFGEQGYKANITDKKKESMKKAGARYMVSYGLGKTKHLAPGIWFVDGLKIAPMFMFVKKAKYRKHFDYLGIADAAVSRTFAPAFNRRMANAMRTAK